MRLSAATPHQPFRRRIGTAILGAGVVATMITGIETAAPAADAAPVGRPSAPFPHECRSGATLTLGDMVPIVAAALKREAPGNAVVIDHASTALSHQLQHSAISTLLITKRASEVSPGQGVQATHGANALVQRVLSIKNGTYRDGYRLSSITIDDAIETVLVGLEATDALVVDNAATALGQIVSTAVGVPIVGSIVGKVASAVVKAPGALAERAGDALADRADSTCLASGDGTVAVRRETVTNSLTGKVSPELTAFAEGLTLSRVDCRPLADLSLDEAVGSYGAFREAYLPPAQRAAFRSGVAVIRADLRKVYVSNAFVPKDKSELTAVFAKIAALPLIGGPGLVYAAGVLQNISAGGELTHMIPLSSTSVNAVFNGARTVNDLTTFSSAPEYALATTQGAAKALCRTVDEAAPYPGADTTVYAPNPTDH